MKDFKKRFVASLPQKIQKNLNKNWIITNEDTKMDEEEHEIDLMKNPMGKKEKCEAK